MYDGLTLSPEEKGQDEPGDQRSANPGKRQSLQPLLSPRVESHCAGPLACSSPVPGLSPPVLWAAVGDKAEGV